MAAISTWVLRGAVKYTRKHCPHVLISRSCSGSSRIASSNSKYADGNYGRDQHVTGGYAFFSYESPLSSKSFLGRRSLCLLAGGKAGNGEHNGAVADQEPKRSGSSVIDMDNENEGELASDVFFETDSEDNSIEIYDNSLDLLDIDLASSGAEGKGPTFSLFKFFMKAPCSSVNKVLEKWIEDGNIMDRGEVSVTLFKLRKRQLYDKALQFVEWLEARKCLDFVEYDYASHLDLVAKVHGLQVAETYISNIPESFRGEIVYRTFLANCVSALNVKKAEEAFNAIRDSGLPITTFACDQLLLLYRTADKRKVYDVLLMMEKESINPSIFTYRILIDLKGRSYDITGMELIVEKMKAEGMLPDLIIQSTVAGFYIVRGLNEKADAALKEMEGDDIKENRDACKFLLPLYASLHKAADVERIWKVCEAKPRFGECLAAIEAWGKAGHVEKAEEVFEKALELWTKVSSKCYDTLLRVYANRKLLFEGEDLVKRMKESGCKIGPLTCDALVNLYVKAGEVEKADHTLFREARMNNFWPLHSSYITLLQEYSMRGDIHNSEKVFHKLKQNGHRNRMKLYHLLLEAYLNAKSPAYGFRERMRADNIFPNKQLAQQLAAVDALWKAQGAELQELDEEPSLICSERHGSSPSLYEFWQQRKKQ